MKLKRVKEKKTLDRVLLCVGIFLALFIITMCVFFALWKEVPDTLVTSVLSASGVELLLTAWITTTKIKHKKDESEDD